jgi:hypothetical protein
MPGTGGLVQQIPAGEMIKPWLMIGAFNLDFSDRVVGLTYFEQPPVPTTVGIAAVNSVVEETRSILASSPREGDETSFLGHPAAWSLVRGPEKYYSWGTYNIKNHLGAAVLSSLVTPETPGKHRFQIQTRIYQRVVIYINEKLVFDNELSKGKVVGGVNHYEFTAVLNDGENRLNVGLFRLARMAQVGIRLVVQDTPITAAAPLGEGMDLNTRQQVEEELASIRFERDLFYPDHAVGFTLGKFFGNAQAGRPSLGVRLSNQDGKLLFSQSPQAAGNVVLCQGADLSDEAYQVECAWKKPDGKTLTRVQYTIRKVTPHPAPQGYDRIEERRKLVLELNTHGSARTAHDIWTQVARYALGQYDRVEEKMIRETCLFIAARNDCADFVIQGILRLMFWEREKRRLSPEINALMKDTVLRFKYWVDEPGDTVMYMGSENHRLLFHVAEWMAGWLYPTEVFTNSQQNGLFHYQKAYVYIT